MPTETRAFAELGYRILTLWVPIGLMALGAATLLTTLRAGTLGFGAREPGGPSRRLARVRWLAAGLLALAGLLLWVRRATAGVRPYDLFFPLVGVAYELLTVVLPGALVVVGALSVLGGWAPRRGGRLAQSGKSSRQLAPRRLVAAGVLLALAGALVLVRVYATHIEPYRLQVRRVTIRTADVDRRIRILHMTDVQSPSIGEYEAGAFRAIRALEPDLVLNTGDLLQPIPPASMASEEPKLEALFETLDPPLGIYSVMGNLEHSRDFELKDRAFGGMVTLQGSGAVVRRGKTVIRIWGLGISSSSGQTWADPRPEVERWIEKAAPGEFTILMGHRPDYVARVSDLPMDLCLAGHTHGGQLRIPGFGPLVTSSSLPRRLARGFHRVGSTSLNVSAGIGAEHAFGLPSIRLFSPPDVTLIELVPARDSSAG